MPLVTCRLDTGQYLAPSRYGRPVWTEDLQKGRLFKAKNHAVCALTGLYDGPSWRRNDEPRPTTKIVEVGLVDLKTLADLNASADKLARLEAAGVDNWDGYDFAMAPEED